jgi:hypothetical protein
MCDRPHEIPERVRLRFWSRVEVGPVDECWPWRLSTKAEGYGQIGWTEGGHDGRRFNALAHRLAFMLAVGPIPDGLTVDHLCRNPPCCNPAHLRLLTNAENAALNSWALKTHCPQGHEYTPENTYRRPSKNGRECRACRPLKKARRRQRRKEAQ